MLLIMAGAISAEQIVSGCASSYIQHLPVAGNPSNGGVPSTEARTEATRQKRMAATLEWLAEGKQWNWKYATGKK